MKAFIKEKALELGFDAVGISDLDLGTQIQYYRQWLDDGFHAGMDYLKKRFSARANPRELLPSARSVIVCAVNYLDSIPEKEGQEDRNWLIIARYARGQDYHPVLERKLDILIAELHREFGPQHHFRRYVDTGPVLERAFAEKAGVGWIGKNCCLIHPRLGSFLFLGVILTDLELEPDVPAAKHCGRCVRCIEACPTKALVSPFRLDARKCISYHTIENRGRIPEEIAGKMGALVFGCDICQEVCPWNRKATVGKREEFRSRPEFLMPAPNIFLDLVLHRYPAAFKRSPLKRAKQSGLLRNTLIAMANLGEESLPDVAGRIPRELQSCEGVASAIQYVRRRQNE